MPLDIPQDLPTKFPSPDYLTLSNFKRGVITLIDKSRLPKDALQTADNIFLYEDGQPGPRPGVGWFGTSPGAVAAPSPSVSPSASRSPSASLSPSASESLSISPSASLSPSASRSPSASQSLSPSASRSPSSSQSMSPSASRSPSASVSRSISPSASFSASISASPSQANFPEIDGFDYFDFNGAIHLVAAAGGAVYRTTDDGATWTLCTGASYTAGHTVNMNQHNSFLYLTNGVDSIIRYDGTTTLVAYTALTTPAAATVARTGLAASTFTYYYKISAVNSVGFTTASASVSQAVSLTRDSWDTTTNYLTLTLPALQATQTRYDIYMSEDNQNYYYLGSSTSTTFKDDGTAVVVPSTTAPVDDTTTGPLVEELVNVGSRMYGVRDSAHRYRVWYSSGSQPFGVFSNAFDGGYLEFQPGGKFIPTQVADYRDGKNNPLATIFCRSADGQGCIIQMTLDGVTVGDVTVTVPSAFKLPGSRGTPAPNSVVNVLNDYMFYNTQAFYNLGSRAQFLNLLSTDESSANIRPTVKQISSAGESMIASVYFDAKVYFSVPYGSSDNNYTAIYDTERKAWLPTAFTLGFKKFLRYTDTSGNQRLLGLKPGDPRLSEISTSIQGDYGEPFSTSLYTGLYPTTKNRFEFQWTEEGEVEFSNPQGAITVEMIGIERTRGLRTVASRVIANTSSTSTTGHSTFLHSTTAHSDTSSASTTYSEPSVKRYFNVNKEINAIQWHVSTNSLSAKYILRTLQSWGTNTEAGKPRAWLSKQ